MVLEKDIENLIARYPDEIFPNEGLKLISQQYHVEGKIIDILFEDKYRRKIIVEVKRGILSREASGQIAEYYGLLKSKNQNEFCEMILVANIIPKERRLFLEHIGIECKELGISWISEIAKKYGYEFIDEQPKLKDEISGVNKKASINDLANASKQISVWIFQGNPLRYDILNALSDEEIGNSMHWLVNQHRKEIGSGHLGLIWMSGPDAGIYAITRVNTVPQLMQENAPERKYWINVAEEKAEALRVEMTILKRMINYPILKKKLIRIPGLEKLSILRQHQGTNFPVRDYEWQIISKLISE